MCPGGSVCVSRGVCLCVCAHPPDQEAHSLRTQRQTPPNPEAHPHGQTDRCKNITLPQTSFVGGKTAKWTVKVCSHITKFSLIFTTHKRSLGQGNIFTPVCHSVHRGACVVAPGGGGHAWLLLGGMCGCSRGCGCSQGRRWHVWLLLGVCMVAPGAWHVWMLPGGMHGCSWGGRAWLLPGGACMVALGGVHGIRRDAEIRSMSGWYASYWNAFLFT